MMTSRLTVGILGFFAFAFCVDTAISDAQIFRGRRCTPNCQQPPSGACCQPCCRARCCPSDQDCMICVPCRDEEDCGTCTACWNGGNQCWETSPCSSGSDDCYCKVPEVLKPGGAETVECKCANRIEDKPAAHRFFLDFAEGQDTIGQICVDSDGTNKTFKFQVIDGTGHKKWTVSATYDSAFEYPQFSPIHNTASPNNVGGITFHIYLNDHFLSYSNLMSSDDHMSVIFQFGDWEVMVTRLD